MKAKTQKQITRDNLKKIQKLFSKMETLFNELPNSVQNNIYKIHNSEVSLNHFVRWGEQTTEDLLEKNTFNKITQDI